jgi:hypothetical protein
VLISLKNIFKSYSQDNIAVDTNATLATPVSSQRSGI